MADPYKNNMQANKIESNFLYRSMNIILLYFFLKKGEQEEKYSVILKRNERWVLRSCRRELGAHEVRTSYLILSSSKWHIS